LALWPGHLPPQYVPWARAQVTRQRAMRPLEFGYAAAQ
jgi:hypothetical protein